MAGESFSVADIAAFTIARAYYDAIEWGEHPELAHWYAEVARRPAVLRGPESVRVTRHRSLIGAHPCAAQPSSR
ncbi:hypothetical protein ACU4GD_21575 [Cupriavidus basilensis]